MRQERTGLASHLGGALPRTGEPSSGADGPRTGLLASALPPQAQSLVQRLNNAQALPTAGFPPAKSLSEATSMWRHLVEWPIDSAPSSLLIALFSAFR